jgi:putative NADH-flavin reductase
VSRISLFGGTGYTGRHIAAEAADRGHEVVSISRSAAESGVPGVQYRSGSLLNAADRAAALEGADVVIIATAPRGDMATTMRGGTADLAADADRAGVRVGVVGGAGSSYVSEGGPKFADTLLGVPEAWRQQGVAEFPEAWRIEITVMGEILDDLQASPDTLDWFVVCPPRQFGPLHGGPDFDKRVGRYRIGGDVLVTAADGSSLISGPDLAMAFVDEIESPRYRRRRLTVGY